MVEAIECTSKIRKPLNGGFFERLIRSKISRFDFQNPPPTFSQSVVQASRSSAIKLKREPQLTSVSRGDLRHLLFRGLRRDLLIGFFLMVL